MVNTPQDTSVDTVLSALDDQIRNDAQELVGIMQLISAGSHGMAG